MQYRIFIIEVSHINTSFFFLDFVFYYYLQIFKVYKEYIYMKYNSLRSFPHRLAIFSPPAAVYILNRYP